MHRTRTLVVAALLVLGLAAGGSTGASASAEMVTVTASVVDQGGNPIANADLTASRDGGSATATSKSNGKAFVDVPAGANVSIAVDHPVYVRNHPYELRDAEEGSVTIDVARQSESTVTVSEEGGPVADARVRFRKDGRIAASGRTDPDGEFESGVLMAGEYTLSVVKPGYYRATKTVTVRGEANHEVSLEPGTVTVSFRVRDQNFEPAEPVAGASIEGEAIGSVKTQGNGVQRVSLPVNSEIDVTVRKDGYRTVRKTITVEESDRDITIATRKEREISFDLLNDRVVVGEAVRIAVADQYGDPVREANVLLDGRQVGTTDDSGVVVVTIDSPGEHTIRAETESRSTDERTVVGVRPAPPGEPTATPIPTDDATPAVASRAAASDEALSGIVAVPGTAGLQIHLRSLGAGVGLGAVLALVLVGYLRLRLRSGSDG